MESFERGVEDFTAACGSGALAVAALFTESARRAGLRLRVASGALLEVTQERPAWRLQGPAVQLARGRRRLPSAPPGED